MIASKYHDATDICRLTGQCAMLRPVGVGIG